MTSPHAFRALKPGSNRCQTCGGWSEHPAHSLELWTDADRDRENALRLQEAQDMTDTLRTVKDDVSRATGILERNSPLFFGTGSNPVLF